MGFQALLDRSQERASEESRCLALGKAWEEIRGLKCSSSWSCASKEGQCVEEAGRVTGCLPLARQAVATQCLRPDDVSREFPISGIFLLARLLMTLSLGTPYSQCTAGVAIHFAAPAELSGAKGHLSEVLLSQPPCVM